MIPLEVRFDFESGRVAVKTELDDPRTWLVFDASGGAHYAPGNRPPDEVENWTPYTPPEPPAETPGD